MHDLQQEVGIFKMFVPAAYNSAHTADWVNMENHQFATFIIQVGAVTAGVKFKVQKATNKSGSGATNVAQPFIGNVYYTNKASAAKASYTKTSASSSGSVHYIPVGTSANATYYATVDATAVTSASKAYISLVAKGNSASTMNAAAIVLLWGTRYKQQSIPDYTL